MKGRQPSRLVPGSHVLTDVERVVDTVAFLQEGRVRLQAPLDELKVRMGTNR